MNRPSDLVAIPPLARTVIYYLIAEAIIVSLAVDQWLGSGDSWWALAFIIANGNAVLFFGTAAAKVSNTLDPSAQRGYASGVSKPNPIKN